MQSLECLPDFPLTDNSKLSRLFMERGAQTFHAACRMVQNMPYEDNSVESDVALFIDGHGTCTSKHRAVAVCAAEHGYPVYQVYGIYPLDETIVEGVDPILSDYGIPFVPVGHCFLAWQDVRVDLTEGNRNGKRGPIHTFLATVRLAPYSQAIIDRLYALADASLRDFDPRFARTSQAQIEGARTRCKQQMERQRVL